MKECKKGEAKIQIGGQCNSNGHFLRKVFSNLILVLFYNVFQKSRIYRRTQAIMAPIPQEYQPFLRQVNNWNFNSFELDEITNGHALKYIGFELFNRYGFLERFKVGANFMKTNSQIRKNSVPGSWFFTFISPSLT